MNPFTVHDEFVFVATGFQHDALFSQAILAEADHA
jgi:hypothetical protein